MNKPAAVGSVLVLGLAAFVAGRYTTVSQPAQPSAKRILYYVDPMHPAYRSNKPGTAPDCGMALEPVYEGDPAAKLELPTGAVAVSPEKQRIIGTRVETVVKTSGRREIRTTGRVVADDNRVYRLTAVTDGRVQSLGDNPAGSLVKKDQVLATFYSREFRNAEQAYLGSLGSLERLRSAGRDPEEKSGGDVNLRINEEQLRALGMGDPQIKELARTKQITRDIEVTSPVDGVVLERNISREQRFEGHVELYRIADLSKVWILADMLGDDANLMRPGTRVRVSLRERSKTFYATVSTAPPLFDSASRTLKLRLEADNPGLLLRPDMFVDVNFNSAAPAGISVPAEAVLDSGRHKIVYVETSENVFEPRDVEVGSAFGDRVTVSKGLSEGDRVVTAGNFMIDSESRMKAPDSLSAPPPAVPAMGTAADHTASHATAPVPSHPRAARPPASASEPKAHAKITAAKLDPRLASEAVVDPACRMPLSAAAAKASPYRAAYKGRNFVFCSAKCKAKFEADPDKYSRGLTQSVAAQTGVGAS